jgi:hypothetical protein
MSKEKYVTAARVENRHMKSTTTMVATKKKMHYEGISGDVDENKGSFLCRFDMPAMCNKNKALIALIRRYA